MEKITEIVEGKEDGQKGKEIKNDETISRSETHKTKSYGISIDCGLIPSVPVNEQASALRDLNVNVFNQEEFEEGVIKQVDEAIAIRETEELVRCWEKDLKAVDEDIRTVTSEILGIDKILNSYEGKSGSGFVAWRKFIAAQKQKDNKLRQLKKLRATQKSLHLKLGMDEDGEVDSEDIFESPDGSAQCVTEDVQLQVTRKDQSERDVLVKTGQMTPFGGTVRDIKGRTHFQNIAVTVGSSPVNPTEQASDKYSLGERIVEERLHETCKEITGDESLASDSKKWKAVNSDDDEYVPEENELKCSWYEDDDEAYKGKKVSLKGKRTKHATLNVSYTEEDDIKPNKTKKKTRMAGRKRGMKPSDDGNEKSYRKRIRHLRIKELLKKRDQPQGSITSDEEDYPDMEFDKGLKIPGKIWHQLYKYQQTGVQWLWELHCQQAGGIVGDEMGLGKTIQMIVFLAGLKYSKISARKSRRCGLGPVLIVCPVTVLHQWVQEFHKWWPEFRVAVLHETGTYQGFKQELIRKLCSENGVLVTSYSGVRQHQEHLLTEKFDYIILDEGHKIRNPDAEITITCKQFRTPHRIILSGSPMQNNLRELWSLFDFVFPGKLGTLPVFMTEFSVPITMGGYSNASKVQVETAYKCACVLRDTINPYLLRRLKKDVKMSLELPSKNEQVLFCRLTDEQRELYQQYLDSKEVQAILAGNFKVFPGLIMLRKICNHPDLTSEAGSLVKAKQDYLQSELVGRGEAHDPHPDDGYGGWRRSGKMIVVDALLKMWLQQGHRVLLFSQTRQMLNILEEFVTSKGYTYFRMDGSTPVATRQPLITTFNQDTSISLFLLTTRVGGLGVNLVGADRIIIYDPDWNPSTDTQARERAWRIGQSKPVTIYRLLTTGTIEEKIYHRQIFKQFLTNRVLSDPKQRRFFKSNDLYELFTLDSCDKQYGTETSAIFAGSNCEVKVPGSHKVKRGTREKKLERRKAAKVGGSGVEGKLEMKQYSSSCGSFCVDWRDAEETKNLGKTELKKKQSEEEGKKGFNEDGQNMLPSRATGYYLAKVSTVATDVQPSGGDGCLIASIDQDRATVVDCVEMPDKYTVPGRFSRKSGTSISPVVAETSVQGSVSSADCKPTKVRKKRISSLSNDVLRKRIKLKEKKKRRRRRNLDGHHIEHLDYHEMFNPSNNSQSSAEEMEQTKQQSAHQDQFILRQLFKKTGVHSALKHDVIMESSNPDLALVESEASRVAENAVKALKRSRQRCLGATSGVPTWTGVSGGSGFSNPPAKRPRFGQKSSTRRANSISKEPVKEEALEPKPHFSGDLMGMKSQTEQFMEPEHSSQLLAKMRARNNLQTSDQCSSRAVGEKDNLLVEMRNFVALQGSVVGQATTEEILDEFGSRLPKNDSTVFRSMLRKICTFSRDSAGQGIWKLNSDFT